MQNIFSLKLRVGSHSSSDQLDVDSLPSWYGLTANNDQCTMRIEHLDFGFLLSYADTLLVKSKYSKLSLSLINITVNHVTTKKR